MHHDRRDGTERELEQNPGDFNPETFKVSCGEPPIHHVKGGLPSATAGLAVEGLVAVVPHVPVRRKNPPVRGASAIDHPRYKRP